MAIQIWQKGDKIKNDRFQIIKQLGTGGFGITYLAEDTIKKQQIVIKTLNANQQSQVDFAQKQENFVKEGFTLKTFNHPHIVKVYEPIQIGDLWGLVMEYIPGQDLADYIIANGRLGEAEALNYIDQIAQALDCVHEQKFFHRDVKPHNIMLRQDRGEAVLIDFGIAKEFVDLETIYLSNSLGTELYKPIEQYEKRGQFGAYTDIYALAVTLYHLLTGAAPGGGSPLYTSKARKDAHDKGWGGNLEEHLWGELANAGVSERTQAAIKAGMEIDPSQRPQSMAEFRKLLGLVKEKVADSNELDPDIILYCMVGNRGEIKIELGREERILRGCERTLKIQTDNHDIWGFRGYILLILGRYQEALSSFDRALEIQSNSHQHWVFHGTALYYLSRYQEALSSVDHALEIQPSMPWRLSYRIDAQYKLVRAEDNAEDDFDRGLIIQSVYSDSWFSRGVVLSRLGRDEEAILSYDRALEIQPSNQECFEHRQIELGKITAPELTK